MPLATGRSTGHSSQARRRRRASFRPVRTHRAARERFGSAAEVLDALIDARLLTSYEVPDAEDGSHQRIEVVGVDLLKEIPLGTSGAKGHTPEIGDINAGSELTFQLAGRLAPDHRRRDCKVCGATK